MEQNAIHARLAQMSIEEIGTIAATMSADLSDEAGVVLQAALDVLENKMCDSDFARFCSKLEAL